MIYTFVTDSEEAIAAISSIGVSEVWINGSETFVTIEEVAVAEPVVVKIPKKVKVLLVEPVVEPVLVVTDVIADVAPEAAV